LPPSPSPLCTSTLHIHTPCLSSASSGLTRFLFLLFFHSPPLSLFDESVSQDILFYHYLPGFFILLSYHYWARYPWLSPHRAFWSSTSELVEGTLNRGQPAFRAGRPTVRSDSERFGRNSRSMSLSIPSGYETLSHFKALTGTNLGFTNTNVGFQDNQSGIVRHSLSSVFVFGWLSHKEYKFLAVACFQLFHFGGASKIFVTVK
jgi:hypothetical protein